MGLIDVIKQASIDAMEANNPVAIMFGVVTKVSPLEINVEQRFTLTKEFLVFAERLSTLSIGDKLILLRVQGGQKYVALDKVVG